MSHHLTPYEIADKEQMDLDQVLQKCHELNVPILHGRIDYNLFTLAQNNSSQDADSISL